MKTTKKYAKAGVDIDAGDAASSLAGKYAATTFAGRNGMIGSPVKLPGGFAGAMDFGKFLIVTGDDGTGTKMEVAERMQKFDTIGSDLLAMVSDDAICLGAEVISITNTLDCRKVDKKIIGELLKSLAAACKKEKILISGGEIAEVGKAVNGLVWNATAIGIVAKDKIIDGSKIKAGDAVIALRETGLRSNGFSLARYILRKRFGESWHQQTFKGKTWGELLLTPSQVYHSAILSLVGRYGEKSQVNVKGIAHITGGGVEGNLPRIFREKKFGAALPNLWLPTPWMEELIKLGRVTLAEAREVWNLGNGMLIVVAPEDVEKTIKLLAKAKVAARLAGEINTSGKITF
ncbi:MAG: phosphoribosylformylglycinamidine cyclo-ligase [Candidatus Gracilibacteria bacterium]|jgi:phosphoribosylformylglycinamidine cyclo-ligase|nr:phosphoribosylformylglycinamidine cyclo-ligase [Candidatus Gracilibacteria bacterium]MDD5179052.1 phosphoribosylformylglycinamidine cyclo-ligase [Candidatus Gracilibacteria bacterium]